MYKLLESVVTLCCLRECAFSTFGLYQNSASSSHFWSSTLCLSSHTSLCHHFVFTSLSSPSYSLHISVCVISLSSHVCLRRHFTDFESSRLQSKPIKRERWGDEERGKGGLEGGLDGGGAGERSGWANWEEKTGFCDAGRKITLARFSVDFTLHQTFIGL